MCDVSKNKSKIVLNSVCSIPLCSYACTKKIREILEKKCQALKSDYICESIFYPKIFMDSYSLQFCNATLT